MLRWNDVKRRRSMKNTLKDIRVAVLVCDGFEEVEMTAPKKALEEAGATVDIITPQAKPVKGWEKDHWSQQFEADAKLEEVDPSDYHALLLPGGVMNPDKLRTMKDAVDFASYFFKNNKPIAAICHGPLTLVETALLTGRKLTSYPSIKTDLINAGADWTNEEVVVDDNLVTSRKPDDIPAFNEAIIKLFAKSAVSS